MARGYLPGALGAQAGSRAKGRVRSASVTRVSVALAAREVPVVGESRVGKVVVARAP